jgi:hypothetical protein
MRGRERESSPVICYGVLGGDSEDKEDAYEYILIY